MQREIKIEARGELPERVPLRSKAMMFVFYNKEPALCLSATNVAQTSVNPIWAHS